jgi:hypothetical protein
MVLYLSRSRHVGSHILFLSLDDLRWVGLDLSAMCISFAIRMVEALQKLLETQSSMWGPRGIFQTHMTVQQMNERLMELEEWTASISDPAQR